MYLITYDIPNVETCYDVGVHVTLMFRVKVHVMFAVQTPRRVAE
jgi:hypothetical protein